MRILESGREQRGWATEATCTGKGNGDGGCGAKLLVEQMDVFETSSSCRDETDHFETFECPQCHRWTDLTKGLVPSHIVALLPHRTP